jgi:hypothetical protein
MKDIKSRSTAAVLAAVALVAFAEEGPNGMRQCTDDGTAPNCTSAGQSCSGTYYSEPCTTCVSGDPTDNCVATGDYTVDVTVYSNGTCKQLPGQEGLTCADCDVSGPNPTTCQYTSG